MHENGKWAVKDGKIAHKTENKTLTTPAMVLDLQDGSVLRIDNHEKAEYLFQSLPDQKVMENGIGRYFLVWFPSYEEHPEPDIVCTLINHFSDNIGTTRMLALLSLIPQDEILEVEIKQLQEQGY